SVVHLVNVIAGEDQDMARGEPPQYIDILIHRVGGPLVPARHDALLRGQQLDELIEPAVEKAPAALHMTDQALRLVLSAHSDAPNAGIDAIRKREIDDPELAAERHRRFGAPVRELLQPASAPPARMSASALLVAAPGTLA